ncbi:hypothetical protein PYCC9005_002529 [Savitreella phatthalungensis]
MRIVYRFVTLAALIVLVTISFGPRLLYGDDFQWKKQIPQKYLDYISKAQESISRGEYPEESLPLDVEAGEEPMGAYAPEEQIDFDAPAPNTPVGEAKQDDKQTAEKPAKPQGPDDSGKIPLNSIMRAPLWTASEAQRRNSKSCPPEDANFDRNLVHDSSALWAKVSTRDIIKWRRDMVNHVAKAKHSGKTAGRGIVMAAGETDAIERALVNIRILRAHACKLPVEIYYFTEERNSITRAHEDELRGMNAKLVELKNVAKGDGWKAFHIKAVAMQRSSFDEILFLDSDSYTLRDPAYLFDTPQFKERGVMLWPDYTKSHPLNPVWRLLGQPCRPEFEAETGQIMVDRRRHQDVLFLAEYFALEWKTYYSFMGGDRESFRIACLALGVKWAGPGRMMAMGGVDAPEHPGGHWNLEIAGIDIEGPPEGAHTGGHTMLQADPSGKWLFVHANLIKHVHLSRANEVTWARVTRLKQDKYVDGTTYGDIAPFEDKSEPAKSAHEQLLEDGQQPVQQAQQKDDVDPEGNPVPAAVIVHKPKETKSNAKLGDGIRTHVSENPNMVVTMWLLPQFREADLITEEDWARDADLAGFEDLYFEMGGIRQ